MTLEVL